MSALKRHKKTHSDEKPFACNHCHKSFQRRSDLNRHLQSHIKAARPAKKYSCPARCGQEFSSQAQQAQHRCEKKDGGLRCDQCRSVLATKVEWGVHMWKHTKDPSYILTSETDSFPEDKAPRELQLGSSSSSPRWTRSQLALNKPINMQIVQTT